MAQKGRTVCVYIQKDWLERAKATGKPLSKVINEALERYFQVSDITKNTDRVVELLQGFNGGNVSLLDAWEAVQREREHDRV